MKKNSSKKFSWYDLISPHNGRSPIFAFTVFGILTIWIFNIPIYLFRLGRALLYRDMLPPVRTLFYVPKFLDSKIILPVLGITAIILFFYIDSLIFK